jgi:hypothetical protein
MQTINDIEQFTQFIGGKLLPAVCFHSPFSAYSRRTVATLSEIEPQFASVAFGLADVDGHDFSQLTSRYAIVALPTVILFRGNGQTVLFSGERTAKSWIKLLENWLPSSR